MKELTKQEMKSVNGGIAPLLIFFATEAVYGFSVFQTLRWLDSK